MKVYALVGKSGTGKSYQAHNLCKELNIESIIDDGLFIHENQIVAGVSAKRQSTKIGAVKTALFLKEEQKEEVISAIREKNPRGILLIGTSNGMVRRIAGQLRLPEISEIIDIMEITTAAERTTADKQRNEHGKHVIPVPTFQLKRQFSGYFVDPLRIFRGRVGNRGNVGEKSVVRPTYSYLGDYNLSDKVFSDIVELTGREIEGVDAVLRVVIATAAEGIDMTVMVNMKFGFNLLDQAKLLQKRTAKKIEKMTAFNVNRFDIEVKGLI